MRTKDAANLANVTPGYVSKVKSGKITGAKAERVKQLLAITDEDIKAILAHPLLHDICEVAIARAKKNEVRRYAAWLQLINESLRK